jgi:hypothetical protein
MKKTVYVIGAGASYEAKLPTGDALKKIISKLLDDPEGLNGIDSKICEALYAHMKGDHDATLRRFIPIAKHISNGLFTSISIDNYIDEHRDNKDIELCGKLAIVRSIIEAEKNSILYISRGRSTFNNIATRNDFYTKTEADKSKTGIRPSALENTWYIPFFKLLTEKCSKRDLEERFRSITLIIFNYDRCVEHFIYCALQEKYFDMTSDEAANLVKSIKIFHPYGCVGALPFYDPYGQIEFGGELFSTQLLELSQKIKTFTEVVESREVNEMRYNVKNANRLVFLGFAFHEINMNLISPYDAEDLVRRSTAECIATCFQVSDDNQGKIKDRIYSLFGNDVPKLGNMECKDFFDHYSRSLSF